MTAQMIRHCMGISRLMPHWASGRLLRLPQPPCRMLSRRLPLEFRRLFHCLGLLNTEIGRNDFPVESLHLMNGTLTTHRFSRNGPVNREVSAALSRMDFGKDVTKVWQRLHEYVTTDSQTECDKIEVEGGAIAASRLHDAQVGLAEAVYRREWNDEWAPILSLLIPGTRSGGLSG